MAGGSMQSEVTVDQQRTASLSLSRPTTATTTKNVPVINTPPRDGNDDRRVPRAPTIIVTTSNEHAGLLSQPPPSSVPASIATYNSEAAGTPVREGSPPLTEQSQNLDPKETAQLTSGDHPATSEVAIRDSIWSTVDDLRKAHEHFTKGSNKQIVERMGRILKYLEDYAKIVDVAVQHSPEITALVWAGARFLLMVNIIRMLCLLG